VDIQASNVRGQDRQRPRPLTVLTVLRYNKTNEHMNIPLPNPDSIHEQGPQAKSVSETFMVMNFEALNNPNYYAFLLRRYTGHELSDTLSDIARLIKEQKYSADHARSVRDQATKIEPTPITDYDDATHHYGALIGLRVIESIGGPHAFADLSKSLATIIHQSKETSDKYRSDLRSEAFINSLLGTAITDSQAMHPYLTLIDAPTIKPTIQPGRQSEAEDGLGLVLAAYLARQ